MKSARRYVFLVAALILPLAFAGAHSGQRILAQNDEETTKKKIVNDFISALSVIRDNYAGQMDDEVVVKSSIVGMLHTLDPHSSFLDRKEFESFLDDQRSRYTGIGSWIAQREGKVFITSPFPGTPAHRAGIRYGDQIIEVNGESTQGWVSRQVSDKLLGPEGTPVTVKVARPGVSQPLEFKLVREGVAHPSIPNYYLFPGGVGYINLERGFNTTTFDEMREAIRDLKQQGMTSLVLDLRNNRGGLVDQAWRVANLFLYRGQKIVSMRGRPGVLPPVERAAQNSTPEDYPLVVLINGGSASASEIVAGAFQDHDRGRLVGEESFGKALVQHVYRLQDGAGLTLTIGNYFTPSGRMIQREYAGRSFYDYYLRRGDKESVEKGEEKTTDSGRKVYGGGGIEPDVKVKIPQTELELQNTWLGPVFMFTRELTAGLIPEARQFKIDHVANHSHRLQANEFAVDDKVITAFRNFLSKHKELKVNEVRIAKDADWLKRQIRYEVATAACGQEEARRVLLEGDPQMLQAILEVPKAKVMAENILRDRAAARPGELRRD